MCEFAMCHIDAGPVGRLGGPNGEQRVLEGHPTRPRTKSGMHVDDGQDWCETIVRTAYRPPASPRRNLPRTLWISLELLKQSGDGVDGIQIV